MNLAINGGADTDIFITKRRYSRWEVRKKWLREGEQVSGCSVGSHFIRASASSASRYVTRVGVLAAAKDHATYVLNAQDTIVLPVHLYELQELNIHVASYYAPP